MIDYLTEFEANETEENEWVFIIGSLILFGVISVYILVLVINFLNSQKLQNEIHYFNFNSISVFM